MSNSTPPEAIGRLVAARPLEELADALHVHKTAAAAGLWGSSVALVTTAIHKQLKRRVLLICGHLDESEDLADDIELFAGFRPDVMPALELGGSLGRVSEEQVSNRLQMVSRYATGKAEAPILVAPIQALMQAVPSRNQLQQLMLTLKPGLALEPEKLIVWLSEHGYNRLDQVEVPGDFAVRGGIIDIYMPGSFEEAGDMVGLTVRVDFFGDEIESIRKFDLDTLGSGDKLDSVRVMDLKGQLDSGDSTSLFTYLPPDTVVVLWEPLEIAEQAKSYFDRLPDVKGIYPLKAVLSQAGSFARLELSQFDQGTSSAPSLVGAAAGAMKLPITSLQRFETEAKKALRELGELAETHEVIVYCENEGEAKRFCELLEADVSSDACKKIKVPIG